MRACCPCQPRPFCSSNVRTGYHQIKRSRRIGNVHPSHSLSCSVLFSLHTFAEFPPQCLSLKIHILFARVTHMRTLSFYFLHCILLLPIHSLFYCILLVLFGIPVIATLHYVNHLFDYHYLQLPPSRAWIIQPPNFDPSTITSFRVVFLCVLLPHDLYLHLAIVRPDDVFIFFEYLIDGERSKRLAFPPFTFRGVETRTLEGLDCGISTG